MKKKNPQTSQCKIIRAVPCVSQDNKMYGAAKSTFFYVMKSEIVCFTAERNQMLHLMVLCSSFLSLFLYFIFNYICILKYA